MKKRILASLITLCMVLTLLPTVAFAAAGSSMQFGISGIEYGDTVYYGTYGGNTVPWYAIGTNGGVKSTFDANPTSLFLFAQSQLGKSAFQASGSGYYSGSTLQEYMDSGTSSLYNTLFTNQEKALIQATALTDVSVADAHLFPLSIDETETIGYGAVILKNSDGWWWRRSSNNVNDASVVSGDGAGLGYFGHVDNVDGVRPAFNLNPDSVLFTSAAVGGKSSGAVGADALNAVSGTTPTTGWKLTLKDASRSFAVGTTAYDSANNVVTVAYSGATPRTGTAPNEYISAIIKDGSGSIKYYGSIAQPTAENGTLSINLSGKYSTGDTLQVFSEQYNGDYKTDYASEPQAVTLTKNAYVITNNLTNITSDNSSTYRLMSETTDYTAKLSAAAGYLLPNTITVNIGGANLTAGTDYTYNSTSGALNISAVSIVGDITITTGGVAPTYTATVTPNSKTFDEKPVGYSPVAAENFTIVSTGNKPLTNLAVTLGGTNAGSFTLGAPQATTLDASGGTATSTTFTVKPNDNLSVGTYTANIKVSADNMTEINRTVSFTVHPRIDSSINPTKANFDKYVPADISVAKSDRDYTLTSIKNETAALVNGTDYTISGNTVTISKNYLKTLPLGKATITFDYGMATNPTIEITVSDSTPTRAINVNQATGGTVSVNLTSGKVGDTVTVTATPDSGYKLKNILVDGIAITGNTFVMKDANANVTAEFEKVTAPAESSKGTTGPQTGDNSNITLWAALLFISGGAIVTLTVFTKRKNIK